MDFSSASVKSLKATNASPGYYGAYPNTFPSPIGGTADFPDANTDISWPAPTGMDYFNDSTQILPGSIGKMNYYLSHEGPFKGHADAWKTMDTGMLFSYWDSYRNATDEY